MQLGRRENSFITVSKFPLTYNVASAAISPEPETDSKEILCRTATETEISETTKKTMTCQTLKIVICNAFLVPCQHFLIFTKPKKKHSIIDYLDSVSISHQHFCDN